MNEAPRHRVPIVLWFVLLFVSIECQLTRPSWGAENCEQAATHYRQAIALGEDAEAALAQLRKATALCPNFHGWFLTGNAQRALNRHAEALAAYERAFDLAEAPKHAQMARAYAALVRHRLGETCAASRTFQSLVTDGSVVPDWIREPYESFETDVAATGWSPEQMACALETTAAHRTIGTCPKVAVRVEFATDSAKNRRRQRPQGGGSWRRAEQGPKTARDATA